jgi:hypothetical protein
MKEIVNIKDWTIKNIMKIINKEGHQEHHKGGPIIRTIENIIISIMKGISKEYHENIMKVTKKEPLKVSQRGLPKKATKNIMKNNVKRITKGSIEDH